VAADDLAAANAVGIGEDNVEGFDFGMRFEEGAGFIRGGTGGRWHFELLSGHEGFGDGGEIVDQSIDLPFSCRGGNEHHVVERRDQ
jgi:hypothetical protein